MGRTSLRTTLDFCTRDQSYALDGSGSEETLWFKAIKPDPVGAVCFSEDL
jgi:hypothetical protein